MAEQRLKHQFKHLPTVSSLFHAREIAGCCSTNPHRRDQLQKALLHSNVQNPVMVQGAAWLRPSRV
eukprot:15472466-Alexandrium_andersonii.AAC.1